MLKRDQSYTLLYYIRTRIIAYGLGLYFIGLKNYIAIIIAFNIIFIITVDIYSVV